MIRRPDLGKRAFSLVELLVVIGVIAVLAALMLPALNRAKQRAYQTDCTSNLKEIELAFALYLDANNSSFPDRRDLKSSLPGGFHPWSDWPPSDPRGGWAAIVLQEEAPSAKIYSCPAAVTAVAGNAVESCQPISRAANAPACRYWLWRFDRTNALTDPTMRLNFWGKSESQAVMNLQAANSPQVGPVHGPTDVEMVVDSYFPKTTNTVAASLKGRTVHSGGRNHVFLDGHAQFLKDPTTPSR